MARTSHVDSYYAASASPQPQHPRLEGQVDCDVCVVGGGIAGVSTALHLAERGLRVVLLEEHCIGWGASGRSGAQAICGVASGEHKLQQLIGAEDTQRIFEVTAEGLRLIRERIARHAIACDWTPGQMHVAIKPRQEDELRAWVRELNEQRGYDHLRYVEQDELRELVASERYLSGTLDSAGGHLHPLNYTLGLAAAATAAGVTIHEDSRALAYEPLSSGTAARLRVSTARGEVHCDHLALCGNAYIGNTAPPLARKIMAVGTYIIATQPLGAERAAALIRNNAAVTDINWVLDYFRLSADHRLLFGGRVSYSGLDPFNTAQATRARMLAVFPQLADVNVEYSWGGYVDITMNRAPHFGRLAPNVWFLQGFSGHGIALTGIAGKLLADAIGGSAERFDVFARIPHRDFPGGAALRRPALVLAMLWYRLRDLL
ncbi:MAG: FAD-binding oxidoreductase [Steroidobacteraceae bacterium]